MELKSYGYCTRNEFGFFEVFWEKHPTLMDKLLKRNTEFRVMALNSFNPSLGLWVDENFDPISSDIPEKILLLLEAERKGGF